MEKPTNGNVKALAAADESVHFLRLKWNYQSNTLVFSRGTSPDRNCTLTQRIVLGSVSTVYYPIELVASYTVKTRLLPKVIWQLSGQQGDDNLPDHIADKFLECSDWLTMLTEITIPRSFSMDS